MIKRYRMIDGKLTFIGEFTGGIRPSNEFCAGDVPDMMQDKRRNEQNQAKQQKKERLNDIIRAVEQHG